MGKGEEMNFGLLHLGLFLCGISIGCHGIKSPIAWVGFVGLMVIAIPA